jgi:tRNA(fMet)-specific endonuclease VapC
MKNVVVDSDILSYYLKNNTLVVQKWEAHIKLHGFLYLTSVTIFEVFAGLNVINSQSKIKKLNQIIKENKVLNVEEESARVSADIYAELYQIGKMCGKDDILIAGIAIINDLILSTNNEKHFKNMPNLEITNWNKED